MSDKECVISAIAVGALLTVCGYDKPTIGRCVFMILFTGIVEKVHEKNGFAPD